MISLTDVGIICDRTFTRHHLYSSYYFSVANLYQPPKIVSGVEDLKGLRLLFIGDDHHHPHKAIWKNDSFINECNALQITVVILTNEKILDSFFPWNSDNLLSIKGFDNAYHYTIDVDDCIALGTKLHRTAISRSLMDPAWREIPKKEKMVFIGSINCAACSYMERTILLETVRNLIDIDIITTAIPLWEDYIKTIASYKYVFSPIGNGNFFPMRFYEALAVGSIPVHQVRDNTLDYYDIEKEMSNCIFFKTENDLVEKFNGFKPAGDNDVIYMEDYLERNLKIDRLL